MTNDTMSAEGIVRGLLVTAEIIHERGENPVAGWLEGWMRPAATLIKSQAAEIAELREKNAGLALALMFECKPNEDCLGDDEWGAIKAKVFALRAQLAASQQETRAAVEESLIDFIVERDTDMLLAIETKDRRYLEFVLRQWRSLWEDHHEINK